MFRFKLRTLLIATALIAVFLGLQVHVHVKAKQFVEEMSNPSNETKKKLYIDVHSTNFVASLVPFSATDVLRFERRCEVVYFDPYSPESELGIACEEGYLVQCVGEIRKGKLNQAAVRMRFD